MKTSSILDTYQTWLTHREYSPATIQKYTKALARFFADTGAGDIPTRETVAAWRDSLTEKGLYPLPPSTRCWLPSMITKRASTTWLAKLSRSSTSAGSSPTLAGN